jgi:hypothetical protein
MATPSKSKTEPTLNLSDLFAQEEQLRQQLEQLRVKKHEAMRKQSEEIRQTVVDKLQEISKLIEPFQNDENWSWRSTGEFDGVLAELELMPKEAKAVELTDEFKELLVAYLKAQPYPVDIKKLAEGVKGKDGQPAYGVPTLRQRLPVAVEQGIIKVKKDGRANLYFVEKTA